MTITMERKLRVIGATILIVVLLQIIDSVAAKKDPRDCEVCIDVLKKFTATISDADRQDSKKLKSKFEKFCKGQKGKGHRFCWYLGAVENAPTGIMKKVEQFLKSFMPEEKICERLKKVDGEICELRYEKQIDLANTNLKKLRVSELKKILSVWGEDNACKGCMEKSDFIREIERLMPKYDPEAHKKRSQKTEL